MESSRSMDGRRLDSVGCHNIGKFDCFPGVMGNSNLSECLARKEKDGKITRIFCSSDLTSHP